MRIAVDDLLLDFGELFLEALELWVEKGRDKNGFEVTAE